MVARLYFVDGIENDKSSLEPIDRDDLGGQDGSRHDADPGDCLQLVRHWRQPRRVQEGTERQRQE